MKTAAAVLAGFAIALAAYHAGYHAAAPDPDGGAQPTVLGIRSPDGALVGYQVTGVDRPDRVRAADEWVVSVNDPRGGRDHVIYCVPTAK